MVSFTSGNSDNTTEAVHGLDIFTKNQCMNCAETGAQREPIFRCKDCEFQTDAGMRRVKMFASSHKDYSLDSFGSMGRH